MQLEQEEIKLWYYNHIYYNYHFVNYLLLLLQLLVIINTTC